LQFSAKPGLHDFGQFAGNKGDDPDPAGSDSIVKNPRNRPANQDFGPGIDQRSGFLIGMVSR